MEPANSSLRFVVRAPSSSPTPSTSSSNPSPLQNPSSSRRSSSASISQSSTSASSSSSSTFTSSSPSPEGVVVVGFIGPNSDDTTHLINRILDANVFGSGNLDIDIAPHSIHLQQERESSSRFRHPRISYYHEEEKGILFLQFTPSSSFRDLISGSLSSPGIIQKAAGSYSVLEENDSGDLLSMLVMFSVCHVIIYLKEGSCFDTQILKRFRMLQAAKHALTPFVKSHILPMLNSKTNLPSQPSVQTGSSSISPPGRVGGITGRHGSAISLMSGSGSYPSLVPGQCSPTILFVFLDDFLDGPTFGHHGVDPPDTTSMDQSSGFSGLARPNVPTNGSGSVVMLARSTTKTEGSSRKKLQSSLEAQIRFLIKKCRLLAGSEISHSGSRGGTNMSSSPLFSLDASRAIILLDRLMNHKVESLDIVMDIVEDVLNGNATADILIPENHTQSSNKEDIQSIKEFIYRQSDILRGRGGLTANPNNGAASGVGMVAVAAAAAAASAASGKTYSIPELPSMENWLSSTQLILSVLFSARREFINGNASSGKVSSRWNATSAQFEGIAPIGIDAIKDAISCLESGSGLNMKFSISWCQRVMPDAKEIYLKDLPTCYPTGHHTVQLEKALCAFKSMVKGPALKEFANRLEDECTSIWKSGRQLCDAVSLTGKPCVHQIHNNETSDLHSNAVFKPHSSGFVFLHACACGRSRQLRKDPFDFEGANGDFNSFSDCHEFLPKLLLPKSFCSAGSLQASPWSLIRLGGAMYYDASKGMLQSGFCSTGKFLFRLNFPLWEQKELNGSLVTSKELLMQSTPDLKQASITDEAKGVGNSQLFLGEGHNGGSRNPRKPLENISCSDPKISFGRGLPPFAMKKPFSEVVAGSVATNSAFPPLQQRKQLATTISSEKGIKQRGSSDQVEEQSSLNNNYHGSLRSDENPDRETSHGLEISCKPDSGSFLQIGSNVVPVNVNGGPRIQPDTTLKHAVVYVGFEHECSHGHRFLLSTKHLNELGSLYCLPEKSHGHSMEVSDKKVEDLSKSHIHEKVGTTNRFNETITAVKQHRNGHILFSSSEEQNQTSRRFTGFPKSVKDLDGNLHSCTLDDDDGCACSLLNRNLPIYMNCPHCKISKSKKGSQDVKFANTMSQLQRIFLVTPPFPIVLATCPVVQFERSCLPLSALDCERQSQFSLGCRVILPPESFLTLRLPFIYGVELEDRSLHPLKPLEHQPEQTAWIIKGSTLQDLLAARNKVKGLDLTHVFPAGTGTRVCEHVKGLACGISKPHTDAYLQRALSGLSI